jgi:hypothetical protein
MNIIHKFINTKVRTMFAVLPIICLSWFQSRLNAGLYKVSQVINVLQINYFIYITLISLKKALIFVSEKMILVESSKIGPGMEYSLSFCWSGIIWKKTKINSENFQNLFINKLLKSADVILQFFTYQLNKDKVIDFENYIASKNLICILSKPIFRSENVLNLSDLLNFFRCLGS